MRDVNLYTTSLFTIGLYALFGYILNFTSANWEQFILITLLIVFLDYFPVRMPSGIIYSTGFIGFLYLFIQFGLSACVFALMVSTLVTHWKMKGSLRNINAFRFFVNVGMYFLCILSAKTIIDLINTDNLWITSFIVVVVFEFTNMVLYAGILRSLNVSSVKDHFKKRLPEIVVPVIVGTVVLPQFLSIEGFMPLLTQVLYTAFFMGLIIFFSSSYLKELANKDKKIELTNQQFKSLFEHNPDLVYSLDLEGNLTSVNQVAEKITGFRPDELYQMQITALIAKDELKKGIYYFEKASNGEPQHYEIGIDHKSGKRVELNVTNIPIFVDGKIEGVYGIAKDITKRKQVEEMINHMAYHDSLTELPNRRLLMERLELSLSLAKRSEHMLAVMVLDLDRFKYVNDTMGHTYGDLLLVKVSERLHSCLRISDTLARMGGDEFTVVIPHCRDVEEITLVAEKILQVLDQPIYLDGHEMHVTTSIGISLYPNDGEDSETLLKHADIALYQAKDLGKNKYQVYSNGMNTQITQKLELENELRKALQREEFELYYQPQMNTEKGKIVGVEALVRWNHPILGIISPGEFIPLAEETGLIIPIGEWVIRTACLQNQRWIERGYPPIRVSVNVSLKQFQQPNLVEMVENILQETGLEPEYLELEITESVAIQNVEYLVEKLKILKSLGVQIAIDDFGTGYSSLSYLKRYPVDKIKIDRTFVNDITAKPDDSELLLAVIAMARSLKLHVIAEGVETEAQLTFLRQGGCSEYQGYLLSKPIQAEQFESLFLKEGFGPGYETVLA